MVCGVTSEATNKGSRPLKVVFALGYVLQGLANPFQGLTYQPFLRHLQVHYGLGEAAVQRLFGNFYLAWTFKPVIGFLIDAYGRTRTILVALLGIATAGYLLTPLLDVGPMVFIGLMLVVSVVLAGTDVAIDRATVITGDEEARAAGRSRATMVGLNQAICWLAILGTATVSAVLGGYAAEGVSLHRLLFVLAGAPALVLLFVLRLPKDTSVTVPLRRSIARFWAGLHSGPVLGIMLFMFLFHFQPQLGTIFNTYQLETLRFSRAQLGYGLAAGNAGYLVGVLLFMWKGVRWQERFGLRKLFRVYIVVGAAVALTQYMLIEPRFTSITDGLSRALPFMSRGTARLGLLCAVIGFVASGDQLIRMSAFSAAGAVIPVGAAGSLFAAFMAIVNLGFTFSYKSGAWLYQNGMSVAPLRAVQKAVFGLPGGPGDKLSLNMLLLLASLSYFASFLAVHLLPGREATTAAGGAPAPPGPERWRVLPTRRRLAVSLGVFVPAAMLVAWLVLRVNVEPVPWTMAIGLGACLLRKSLLDALLARRSPAA
jgi:hypothetical protein